VNVTGDEALRAIGKHWGKANGFVSYGGGWIVRELSRHMYCQGWASFAVMRRHAILAAGRPKSGSRLQAGYDALKAMGGL
jgi:hypothetical protein